MPVAGLALRRVAAPLLGRMWLLSHHIWVFGAVARCLGARGAIRRASGTSTEGAASQFTSTRPAKQSPLYRRSHGVGGPG